MKNILKSNSIIIAILVTLLSNIGCSKSFLNTEVDTYYTNQTIITDRSTLFSFANAFYTQLQWGFTALDNNLFAAATDEMQESVVTTNTSLFNSGSFSSIFNPDAATYKNYYDGIRAANFFLNYSTNYYQFLSINYDTVTNALQFSQDVQNIQWYRAEAHVARAYYYGELIKRYSGVPIVTNPIQSTTPPDSIYIGQQSYDSCVNYIVKEIDSNKNNLQVNWRTSTFANYDGRFTLGAALAIKARVLLFAASPLHNPTNDPARWLRAINALNDLMNEPGLNLALDKSYANYFNGLLNQPGTGNYCLTSNETIFALRAAPSSTIEGLNYPPTTVGSVRPVCPTDNLVSDYEYINKPNATNPYSNRDPRFAASVVFNGSIWNNRTINEQPGQSDAMSKAYSTKTGYYLKKFLTDNALFTGGATYAHVWIFYRYAEVLLEYAEAVNEVYGPDVVPSGGTITARQALMLVRNRASTRLPSIANITTTDAFRTVVKHERRIELAFEDYRYWDLLRWGSTIGVAKDSIDASVVMNTPIYGVQITTNPVSGGAVYTRVVVAQRVFHAPTNYFYPFPYGDIKNSKNKLVQNPGY